MNSPVLARAAERLRELVEARHLIDISVTVLAKPLTPEEAIGTPGRRDFPIVIGKERVLEATVLSSKGHAFTDSVRELSGTLADVLALRLDTNPRRAIFVATLNAVLRHLGMAEGTVHCRDEDPEFCALQIASDLARSHAGQTIGLIGCNPAIADALLATFGADSVRISDLGPDHVGTRRGGVEVWDGRTNTEKLIDQSDFVLFTGTTLVNGTFDHIWQRLREQNKDYLVYGVTTAGVSALEGVPRICPRGRDV